MSGHECSPYSDCGKRIAALERELLAENTRYVLCNAGWKKTNEILDEAHAAIRALTEPRDLSGGVQQCVFCGVAWWPDKPRNHLPNCRMIGEHAPAIRRAQST